MLNKILDGIINYNDIDKSNARDLFYYSYVNNIDVSKELLATKNERYISLYLKHRHDIDKDIFLDFIMANDSANYIYNIWYENNEYLKYTDLFLNRLIELNNERFILLLLTYYIIVLKQKNKKIDEIASNYLKCKTCYIEENIIFRINKIRKEYKVNNNEFSSHHYDGRDNHIPFIIVMHACNMYEKAIFNFYDEKSDVSAHFVIGRNGDYKQVISLDDAAWGNGTSLDESSDVYYKLSKNKYINSKAVNANYLTFSIEHETLDGSLTELQYQTTLLIVKKIIKYLKDKFDYDFKIDREHIIGHSEVNPVVRTICPGDLFPFDRLIKDLKRKEKVES